jgi:Tol biopolymer transport system component/DNA-binding winged helix-turn-helix (wHTH) protein
MVFGPFEVNVQTGELRKNGLVIRLARQPLQILLTLLRNPGEVVTREQLRRQVWGEGTFVDFEHGLNAAVNKLRVALNDSAEKPRYIETVPARGYRFIAAVVPTHSGTIGEPLPKPWNRRLLWVLACTALCLGVFATWWRVRIVKPGLPSGKLIRLTSDSGLADTPALSPDGKLLAYSSDRFSAGQMDLYVKHVAGGEPIRLTFDGAGNTAPNFSPDGSKIVFRSNRDGGGIYEIASLGGQARMLARDGLDPKFSPDGTQVAYWVGARHVANRVPGSGSIWVVPAVGGTPRRVDSDFTAARCPIWSPDGKSVLVVGYTSAKSYDDSAIDWWLISTSGAPAIRTGMFDALVRVGLEGRESPSPFSKAQVPDPGCWLPASNRLLFSVDSGADNRNLWEIGISPSTGRVNGIVERITAGSGDEVAPSCAPGGSVAFASLEDRNNIWSLPIDLNKGKATGPVEPLIQGPSRREHASLSKDGRSLAFSSTQSGRFNIWLREFATGKETPVASLPLAQRYPLIDSSGARVAFSMYENDKRSVYVSTPGGVPEMVCEGCLRATDWSSDEKSLLTFWGAPYQVDILDVASHQHVPLLKNTGYQLLYARFSPDNRWVSFTARAQQNRARIMIAPIDGPKPVPERAWIKIADEGAEDWANWSPDGTILYFTSARDGHYCLWAQRIDANTRRPEGEAFAVQHLHGRAAYVQHGWSAAGGRVAMVLNEETGNIWMMSH